MREIRFRAWDVDAQRMIDDPFYFEPIRHEPPEDLHNTPMYSIAEDWQEWEDGIRCEGFIMQYTGLRDKNGKDIYEGDVVRLFHGHPSWLTDPFEVVFQCSAFALKKKDKKGSTAFATYLHDCVTNGIISDDDDESALFEVIGNIHENPELLPK